MEQIQPKPQYPTLEDHVSTEMLTKEVSEKVNKLEVDAVKNEGKDKIKISFDDVLNTENNELDIRNNFACVVCKNMALAPVMQCTECEYLYCSSETCLSGVKECQNPKCPKKKEFSTAKVGRIIRNVMSNFEFKHIINGEETQVLYEKKCKLVLEDFKAAKRYKCDCGIDKEFTKLELQEHLMKECDNQPIKCVFCDVTLKRKEFLDAKTHNCVQKLKDQLDEQKRNKEANEAEIKNLTQNVDKYSKQIEEYKQGEKDFRDQIVAKGAENREVREKNQALEQMIQKLCRDHGLVDPSKVLELRAIDISDLAKFKILSHHEATNTGAPGAWGGSGDEKTHQLQNTLTNGGSKWYSTQRVSRDLVGWLRITLPEFMLIKGFGIKSANDCPIRDPKKVRIFAEVEGAEPVKDDLAVALNLAVAPVEPGKNPEEEVLTKGMRLIGEAKDLDFAGRWETQRFNLNQPECKVISIMVMIDDVKGGPDSGDGV